MPDTTLNQDDINALNQYATKTGGTLAYVAPQANGESSGLTQDDMNALNQYAKKTGETLVSVAPESTSQDVQSQWLNKAKSTGDQTFTDASSWKKSFGTASQRIAGTCP